MQAKQLICQHHLQHRSLKIQFEATFPSYTATLSVLTDSPALKRPRWSKKDTRAGPLARAAQNFYIQSKQKNGSFDDSTSTLYSVTRGLAHSTRALIPRSSDSWIAAPRSHTLPGHVNWRSCPVSCVFGEN